MSAIEFYVSVGAGFVVGEYAGERATNQQRELAGSGGDRLGFADADRPAAEEGTECGRGRPRLIARRGAR